MGRSEKVFFLHLPLATKLGTFHWPPSLEHSIGHQVWNVPLAPSFGFTFTSFFFSLKDELRSLGALSFPGHNFQFNLEYLFP
jgi:hypothetical protein